MTNRNISTSGQSNDLHCEQCGGTERLAVIFKQLLCWKCALAFIQALHEEEAEKEMDHASQTR